MRLEFTHIFGKDERGPWLGDKTGAAVEPLVRIWTLSCRRWMPLGRLKSLKVLK